MSIAGPSAQSARAVHASMRRVLERRLQHEVFRRIAVEEQFRQRHEIRTEPPASAVAAKAFAVLPARSPTTGFNCASAMLKRGPVFVGILIFSFHDSPPGRTVLSRARASGYSHYRVYWGHIFHRYFHAAPFSQSLGCPCGRSCSLFPPVVRRVRQGRRAGMPRPWTPPPHLRVDRRRRSRLPIYPSSRRMSAASACT